MAASSRRGERSVAMWNLIAIPFTCWLCALVAHPRKPRLGNEVQELVYIRLVGRQQRLLLLAAILIALIMLTLLLDAPRRVQPVPPLPPGIASDSGRVSADCGFVPLGAGVAEEVYDDGVTVTNITVPSLSGCSGN
jgi:hypothetical protein